MISDEEYMKQRTMHSAEKDQIKAELANLDHRQSQWMDLTVKTFNFACYAKHWFHKGDARTRTMIARSLSQNLILKDRKILLQKEKPMYFLENCKKSIEEVNDPSEPDGSMITKGKTLSIDEVIPYLCSMSV